MCISTRYKRLTLSLSLEARVKHKPYIPIIIIASQASCAP